MSGDIVKNQHYVPQVYLRNFANRERIHCYDKFTKKSYPTNIRNVANERFFYDLKKDLIPDEAHTKLNEMGFEEQMVEKQLSDIEGDFARVLKSIISPYYMAPLDKLEHARCFTKEQKRDMALYIALQALRTKGFRESLIESKKKIIESIAKLMGVPDVEAVFNREYESIEHASLLFGGELPLKLAAAMLPHYWFIGVNTTNIPFYTSDNPVVRQAHIPDGIISHSGFASPGIEIAYPLTSKLILVMREKNVHKQDSENDNRFVPMSEGNVIYFNSLQAFGSYRHVYCKEDKFGLMTRFCEENPEECSPNKQQISID